MPRIEYTPRKFSADSLGLIDQANAIIAEYQAQGFQLTLRQLYYQFVSRDLVPNNMRSYKRIGSVLNDARLAGLVDWEAIVDRTRNLEDLSHWRTPQQIVRAVAEQYRTERWASQPRRVEVWIEKDALVGVIEPVCQDLDIPFFSCRGYTSQSELWSAGQRLGRHLANGQAVTVLHFGDHDPSGKDMTRDITDRLELFLTQDWVNGPRMEAGSHSVSSIFADMEKLAKEMHPGSCSIRPVFEVERIALNWDQIEQYSPPPNPAKLTDSRARGYIDEFGSESWELDALEPSVIASLIEDNASDIIDEAAWATATDAMEAQRSHLTAVSERWTEVVASLS